tara:strand:- start:11106 stop:12833 length:1728 start_codon:yes stop_codon:yes gene_type:complete
MGYRIGHLGLIIPEATTDSSQTIDLVQAKVWRDSLHIQDLKASVQSTNQFLKSLAQAQIPTSQRLEILNLTRPIVSFLCSTIEGLNQKHPINAESQVQVFQIKLSLQLELFNQFKFSLEQAFNDQLTNKSLLANLIFACLQQSCKLLFFCFQAHQPVPKFIWLETHKLYELSEKEGFGNQNMEPIPYTHSQFKNCEDLYKHILIFSLTNPLRFQKEEMLKLYYAIEAWAPLLKLQTATRTPPALFKVDLSQDAPPHYTALDNNSGQSIYYLDFDNIIKRIDILLAHTENPEKRIIPPLAPHESTLCPDILHTLSHIWKHYGQRSVQRMSMTGVRTVAVGLRAIHWLTTEVQKESEKKRDLKKQSSSKNHIEDDIDDDIEEIILDAFSLPQDLQEQQLTKATPSTIQCDIIDRSENGYCLKWEYKHGHQLKTNELIGVLQDGDPENITWKIAIVRWVKETDATHKLIGLETLARQVSPIYLQPREKQKTQTNALFVSDILNKNIPFMIITPKLIYAAEDSLEVVALEQNYEARLIQDLELSPLYAIWEAEIDGAISSALESTQNTPHMTISKPDSH